MRMIVCSVFDKATEAYMRPFVAQTEGQALRMFGDEVNNPQSPLNQHSEDYALFMVAEWYDHDALMKACEPRCLGRAHELKNREQHVDA